MLTNYLLYLLQSHLVNAYPKHSNISLDDLKSRYLLVAILVTDSITNPGSAIFENRSNI